MSEVYNNLHVEQFCVMPTETLIGHLLVNAGKPNSGFFLPHWAPVILFCGQPTVKTQWGLPTGPYLGLTV